MKSQWTMMLWSRSLDLYLKTALTIYNLDSIIDLSVHWLASCVCPNRIILLGWSVSGVGSSLRGLERWRLACIGYLTRTDGRGGMGKQAAGFILAYLLCAAAPMWSVQQQLASVSLSAHSHHGRNNIICVINVFLTEGNQIYKTVHCLSL